MAREGGRSPEEAVTEVEEKLRGDWDHADHEDAAGRGWQKVRGAAAGGEGDTGT